MSEKAGLAVIQPDLWFQVSVGNAFAMDILHKRRSGMTAG